VTRQLPTLEVQVVEGGSNPVVHVDVDGKPWVPWAPWTLTDDETEARRAALECGDFVGYVYRRTGVPFPHIVNDGYVTDGQRAWIVDGKQAYRGGLDDRVINSLVVLGASCVHHIRHSTAMGNLSGLRAELTVAWRLPGLSIFNPVMRFVRPLTSPTTTTAPEGWLLIATDAPGWCDGDTALPVEAPFFVFRGGGMMRMVAVRSDDVSQAARYRSAGFTTLVASSVHGLYAEAAARLGEY
jgi:hypothetical protein